jgi:hypothetical protein
MPAVPPDIRMGRATIAAVITSMGPGFWFELKLPKPSNHPDDRAIRLRFLHPGTPRMHLLLDGWDPPEGFDPKTYQTPGGVYLVELGVTIPGSWLPPEGAQLELAFRRLPFEKPIDVSNYHRAGVLAGMAIRRTPDDPPEPAFDLRF